MIASISRLKKALSTFSRRYSSEFMNELESNIHFVQDPFGDPAHSIRAEQSLEFLLEHADESYPRILALIKSNRASNPIALIEALPRFGRPDSIPVLELILTQGQGIAIEAASLALARHPHNAAREALIRGLTSPNVKSVVAAADGIMSRGDPTVCNDLAKHLGYGDPIVRYHIIQAAYHLGCLSPEALMIIANDDSDKDIRALVSKKEIGGQTY